MTGETQELLALVAGASNQLSQLEGVAKGLIDELASSGSQPTPRLRELLATGEGLVAAVEKATARLGSVLPEAGPSLPPGPSRDAVDAVWAQQLSQQRTPTLLATPVTQPARSLSELAASFQQLPSCSLQLLHGRQVATEAAVATAVLLQCSRAFAAIVHLQQAGSLEPLRVGVLSAAEAAAALADGGSGASLWAPSQHAVFQQLTQLASDALRHYIQQQQQQQDEQQDGTRVAASALELLLLWLATHSDLFSRRSSSSGTLMLADPAGGGGGLLPPLRRPVQLPWQELWQVALNPHLRQAEHVSEA